MQMSSCEGEKGEEINLKLGEMKVNQKKKKLGSSQGPRKEKRLLVAGVAEREN